jgi:hypothetical protein
VKYQRHEWSCGSACVVNALRCFGFKIDESKVIPVAGTTPPSKCKHCRLIEKLEKERECEESKWKCSCDECRTIKRIWRKDCDSGTDHKGVLKALRHFGGPLTAIEYESESKTHAWQWLHGSLMHGRVALLCLDSWRHWALACASLSDRVMVIDPYPSKANLAENGILPLTRNELMDRWWNGRQWVGKDRRLYAISVGRNK